jgi:hypothetical protein
LASSVVPRTIPMPVSSQLVSIPRTSGASSLLRRRRDRAPELDLHDERVDVVGLVVVRAGRDPFESEVAVEPLGARVVGPSPRGTPPLLRPRASARSSARATGQAWTAAPLGAPRSSGCRLRRRPAGPAARRSPRSHRRGDRHEVVAVRPGELLAHQGARPGVAREGGVFERHERVEVVDGCAAQLPGHEVTRFGVERVTSGARR